MYLAAIIAIAGAGQQVIPSDYRLPARTAREGEQCRGGGPVEIIVCAPRRPGGYRIAPLPDAPPDHLMRSYEVGGGATATPQINQIHHESGAFAGMVDRRVTISIRWPF